MNNRSHVELDISAIESNISLLKSLISENVLIAPCVKGNAYGHGIGEITSIIVNHCYNEVDYLCVQAPWEARIIREIGWNKPIVNISVLMDHEVDDVFDLDLEIYLSDPDFIIQLNSIASDHNKSLNVHLLVDTGMSWQGVLWNKALEVAYLIQAQSNLHLKGVTTHFGNSDEPQNSQRFLIQKERFRYVRNQLINNGVRFELFHCANSGAVFNDQTTHFDLIQPGIALYGLSPSPETTNKNEIISQLKPVLSWKSQVAYISQIPTGEWVGYGQTFQTVKPTTLSIIPVGYYDGYPRELGNKSHVLIHGVRCKILGRVCMNLLMADTSNLDVRIGDEVLLIGFQGQEHISADELAAHIDTINYEIVTRINEKVPKNTTQSTS